MKKHMQEKAAGHQTITWTQVELELDPLSLLSSTSTDVALTSPIQPLTPGKNTFENSSAPIFKPQEHLTDNVVQIHPRPQIQNTGRLRVGL
jgi:hypothetical protein